MKLAKAAPESTEVDIPEATHRAAKAVQTRDGDTIITMVTHQIEVDGSEAWVRFGTTTNVGEDETLDDAKWRAINFVQNGAMDAVKATVEKINEVQS